MAYTALYRKLRPKGFDGVIGQGHIVRTLVNQMESSRISHAYLFCGTRGTGKTSTAKIFARAVNCENPQNGSPCNTCQTCSEILGGTSMNVIEIDAASNNGVDNIRDLREEVKYPPPSGKYKVYIIDEVHMLSTGAFNALLKTLEEPPEHVVFILATTDPQKIPPTIHSRCQRFDFKRIGVKDMAQTLKEYTLLENVSVDDDALAYIARISDGAMRDAISVLDQCMSYYYNERITLDKVLDVVGSVDGSVFFKMTDALFSRDTALCMEIIAGIITDGRDINQFVTGFVTHLRNLLVSISAPGSETALDYSAENRHALSAQSKTVGGQTLIGYINVFAELQSRLKYASNERILLEVACIGVCSPPDEREAPSQSKAAVRRSGTNAPNPEPEKPPAIKKAVPDDIKEACQGWSKFTSSMPQPEASYLENTKAGYLGDGRLSIVCDNISFVSILKKKADLITERLSASFGKTFDIQVMHKNLYDQEHKQLYGGGDDFSYDDKIAEIASKINFEIDVK